MMIKLIISLISLINHLWCDVLSEEQDNFRKNHILNKYDDTDWRDDIFWW